MFIRKIQGCPCNYPPPLLKELGYALYEERDRDGDQKVTWLFEEAEAKPTPHFPISSIKATTVDSAPARTDGSGATLKRGE